jgi:hypothetical protein
MKKATHSKSSVKRVKYNTGDVAVHPYEDSVAVMIVLRESRDGYDCMIKQRERDLYETTDNVTYAAVHRWFDVVGRGELNWLVLRV